MPQVADQVIVNEYEPGQGIAAHVDCVGCFADSIASLSLGSACVMDFTHVRTREKVELLLARRSLIVLSGEARFDWRHGIAKRKNDEYQGQKFARGRRVSLTLRKVLLETPMLDSGINDSRA